LLTLDVHVNPNLADYDSRTALHLGASQGHLAVVQILCGLKGIDLSPRDRLGNTPLDDAMRHKKKEVRKYLHSKGGIMGDSQMGVTLCDLSYKCDLDGLRELADSDVALSEADYDYRTALHLAASENHLTIATFLLLEAKVSPNPLDRFLNTPLDDAMRHGHLAMEAFLTDYGGYRGSAPEMKEAVGAFKEMKRKQEADRLQEKLLKEVKGMEVATLHTNLQRLRRHETLEDDMHTFVSNAINYRSLLLRLLRNSEIPQTDGQDDEDDDNRGLTDLMERPNSKHYTKDMRERLLDCMLTDMDDLATRLTATLETEVLPWLQGLNKHEEKILQLFTPDLKPATLRSVDHLKGRARMAKFTRHLWQDKGKDGFYKCTPVGLLFNRVAEAPTDIVERARLEAEALLWASGASHGTLGGRSIAATRKERLRQNGNVEERVEERKGDAEAEKEHAAGDAKAVGSPKAGSKQRPKEQQRAQKGYDENPWADTVYASMALRGILEDAMEEDVAKEHEFGMEQWQQFKML